MFINNKLGYIFWHRQTRLIQHGGRAGVAEALHHLRQALTAVNSATKPQSCTSAMLCRACPCQHMNYCVHLACHAKLDSACSECTQVLLLTSGKIYRRFALICAAMQSCSSMNH